MYVNRAEVELSILVWKNYLPRKKFTSLFQSRIQIVHVNSHTTYMGRRSKEKSNFSSSSDNVTKTKKRIRAKLSRSLQIPIWIKLDKNYNIFQKRSSLVAIGQVVLEKKLTDIWQWEIRKASSVEFELRWANNITHI